MEVNSTFLSNEIRKKPNQEVQEGSGLVVTGRKERGEGKKNHFCHRESHWKNDCKNRQEWLKKKEQAAEADVESVVDTEVLMTSYVEGNTS